MNLWGLLPPALVTRAKAIAALAGAVAEIVVVFAGSGTAGRWAAAVISVLTFLGVYTVPNSNARTFKAGLTREAQ